jgi:FkbM family methyltransferase
MRSRTQTTTQSTETISSPDGRRERHQKARGWQVKNWIKAIRASQPFNFLATSSVNLFLRGSGLHSEFVIKHLHRTGTVRSQLPNGRILRLWSRADDWVSNQVYWRGWSGYEPETVPLFFRCGQRSHVTIDVGAYVGFFTLLAAHGNPEGRVFAFEPMPEIFDRLRRNVELNKLNNVTCIESAIGDSEGEAEFFHTPGHMPCSSSLSFEFMRTAGDLRTSIVPITTIDKFVLERGLDRVDLIKIDTESTEPAVLRGMTETIRQHQPHIVCEVLKGRGSEDLLQEIVRSFGYHAYHLTPNGPVLRDRIEGHPTWLNYLFTALNAESLARL